MKTSIRHLGIVAIGLLAALFATSSAFAQAAAERAPYRVGVEDVLEINVWHNEDVSRQVSVRPDGRITLPLVGEVIAEGLTAEELAQLLTERLKEYLTDPLVSVSVVAINSYSVYLLGRVGTQGEIRLRSPRTFLQVIAMAGGFQEFADTDDVVLVREVDGAKQRIPVNAAKIIAKGTEADFVVLPGDVIIVP